MKVANFYPLPLKGIAIVCFILFHLSARSQTDSLTVAHWLEQAKTEMNKNADVGIRYLDSIWVAVQQPDHNTYQLADYHKVLGIALYRKSNYDSSTYHYELSRKYFEAGGYELDLAKISVNLSINYNRLGEFEKTIASATEALRVFEQLEDRKGISISLNIIGQVYFYNEAYEKAKDYFFQYLTNAGKAQDSLEIAGGYANVGSAYEKMKVLDSSIFFQQKALTIHRAIKNEYGIGNAVQNIGNNFLAREIYDSAIFYLRQAQTIYEKVENAAGLTEVQVNLAESFQKAGDFYAALQEAKEGIRLAEEIKEPFLHSRAALVASKSQEALKNYQLALQQYKLYDAISEEIFNENSRKNIDEINTKYETEKKEQQIELQEVQLSEQEKTIQLNRALLIAAAITVLLLLVIGILVRNRIKRKQEEHLQKERLMAREAELQATVSSQEKERARYARDLHDGFGQMISILNMNLKSLEENSKPDERQEVFEASEQVLNDMYQELKSICFDLMPQTLINQGLAMAIDEYASRINQSGKMNVKTNYFGLEQRLADVQEISFYRIVQEWVNNILKHSDAKMVSIQLTKDAEEITLLIEDDGSGINQNNLIHGKGNGWKNLMVRANLISGTLELESAPGTKGNTLILNAPSQLQAKQEKNTVSTV